MNIVSFSGGKDSTAMLLMMLEKGIPVDKIIFVDTTVAMGIDRYTNTNDLTQKNLRLYGGTNPKSGKRQPQTIPYKWHNLTKAPFKVSEKCCYFMKKAPIYKYQKESNRFPFIGTMACESNNRTQQYIKNGCNSFDSKRPISTPIAFWTEKDVWDYIHEKQLPYSSIYNTGVKRTGCMFCMFGVHLEKQPNRFQLMQDTHPKQYDYCINKLGCGKVLDYINVPYKNTDDVFFTIEEE